MKGVNTDIMFIPPQRSVSLYWVEKWLLVIDVVQIWCLLWIIVAPQLPLNWNSVTYPALICNLDIFHLYFVHLDGSNALNTSKVGAKMVPRILLAAIPVGLAVLVGLLLSLGNRWVNLAHSRSSAAEATETANDRLANSRRSTARLSLSRVFATDIEETGSKQSAMKVTLQNMWYRVSTFAVRSRLILIVWIFAPICNNVFAVVFCKDQADVCSETPLFLSRVVLGLLTVTMALSAIYYVGRHVRQHVVAQTDSHHEEYVQQKEIEYMLHINDSWNIQMLWMFTSFKRECRRVYHRQSLMIVKFTLCLLISLFGTDLFRTQYGLAWIFRLAFPKGFRPSKNLNTDGDIALGGNGQQPSPLDELLDNPLGLQMRTILGCVVIFVFAVCSLVRLPFRQRSSNALHVISWLLLACISGVAFALACTVSPLGVFLPANLVPLLKTLHLLAIAGYVAVYCVGLIRTLLPNSTSALVTARANNLEELTEGQKDEDLRQRQKDMQKVKRRLLLRHGARMIHNAWFSVATNIRLARNSMSAIWSRGSSCALDEDGALYPSFLDSPWPISFYEGRYFIVTYPQVLRALKRARNVIDRYLFADKSLVPLTILDSAHADLQQHLVTFLSLRENHASLSKKDEQQTVPNMVDNSARSNHKELNAALYEAQQQLALFDNELGDLDEDSTDDEEESDTLSEASVNTRMSADTSSDADESNGGAHKRRGLLALPDGKKSPKSPRRVTGSAGGLFKDTAVGVSTGGENREQGADVAPDCQRLEGILSEIRQGASNNRVGVAFASTECSGKGDSSGKQAESTGCVGQEDLLEALLNKASQAKEADSRPTIWDPSTDDAWKSLIAVLDGEAADGAQKAVEVARKSAELDFESLALGTLSVADSPDEKPEANRNNIVGLPRRPRGGQRMFGDGRAGETGLLKRQNGGPLDAIDDLLAEMEEEASEENIPEVVGGSEAASYDGWNSLNVDFERPMLPNTADILEAFKSDDSKIVLSNDDAEEGEYKFGEADAVEQGSLRVEEAMGDSTIGSPASLEQTTSPRENQAIEGSDKADNGGYLAVGHSHTSFGEEHTDGQQENSEEVDKASERQKKRRRKKLRDQASFSHLPESARRAALEFKVRRLSTLSHLSERFRDLPVRRLFNEMHHRQSLNHAFRWVLLEAFETLSGLRSEVAPVTCLPTTLPNGGEALMAVLATRCRQRDQDLSLMNPKKRKILTKLLAIQFLCGSTRRTEKRADAMIEKMLQDFSLILGE